MEGADGSPGQARSLDARRRGLARRPGVQRMVESSNSSVGSRPGARFQRVVNCLKESRTGVMDVPATYDALAHTADATRTSARDRLRRRLDVQRHRRKQPVIGRPMQHESVGGRAVLVVVLACMAIVLSIAWPWASAL